MKRILNLTTLAFCLISALLTAGCTTRLTDFTVLSSKNLDFAHAGDFKRGTNRVTGKDEAYIIIFIPTGVPNIKTAVDRALESVPGAVALVDGVVYAENWWFIIGANSYIVEGTPLIDPAISGHAQIHEGNHMVSFYSKATHHQELRCVDETTFNTLRQYAQSRDGKHINEMLSKIE
jgi:hypothetical protein